MKKPWKIIALAAGLGGVLILIGWVVKIPFLIVADTSGQPYLSFPLYRERTFYTEFTHSVEKTPVREYYALAPEDTLLLTGTEYTSQGAGLPYFAEDGALELTAEGLRLTGMNRALERIDLLYVPFINYRLVYRADAYALADYVPAAARLSISVQSRPLWKIFAH
jgi:hypothetical protein